MSRRERRPKWRSPPSRPPESSPASPSILAVQVQVEDSFGNLETNFNGTINAALASNASGAVLVGTTTATVGSNGIATFSGLIIDTAGIGYTIVLSRGSLNATTDALDVTPAAATTW